MKKRNEFLLLVAIILFLPAILFAGAVPDTGQTKCYNGVTEIPCPVPGADFYGQDSNYTINPMSYTKLDAEGNDLPADNAEDWSMVRDNVTGLIWEVKQGLDGAPNYDNPHDADNMYTWYDSNPDTNGGDAGTPGEGTDTEDFINALNTAKYGGHNDWRMPTIKELASLINYSIPYPNPTIDMIFFPNTTSSPYWSSSTVIIVDWFPVNYFPVWCVSFGDSVIQRYAKNYDGGYVRAVRGKKPETSDTFVDNGDGTVTDIGTGLMWQQDSYDWLYHPWDLALSYCEKSLNLAGYTDWRLPNVKELESLVDYSRSNPTINLTYFPNTIPLAWYWTSTSNVKYTEYSWEINFDEGYDSPSPKQLRCYVRSVRGGQNHIPGNILILFPVQGGLYNFGSEMNVRWKTAGIDENVDILISREGGKAGTFEIIESNTPNDGEYDWIIDGAKSVNCVLKIEPISDPSKGTEQGLFSITDSPPYAQPGGPYIGLIEKNITFDASGSNDPDGFIVEYSWDWDNDGTYDESTTNPVIDHQWSTTISGAVGLRVTDNDGYTSEADAELLVQDRIPVYVDISPGKCPNPLQLNKGGVLTVAILGTKTFDVTAIDPSTIGLSREGVILSAAPIQWSYKDVATPFTGALCGCNSLKRDRQTDLVLKFNTKTVINSLSLRGLEGMTIPLLITGNLKETHGGNPFDGQDCVIILKR